MDRNWQTRVRATMFIWTSNIAVMFCCCFPFFVVYFCFIIGVRGCVSVLNPASWLLQFNNAMLCHVHLQALRSTYARETTLSHTFPIYSHNGLLLYWKVVTKSHCTVVDEWASRYAIRHFSTAAWSRNHVSSQVALWLKFSSFSL